MTKSVVTVKEDTSVPQAAALMQVHRVRQLPVVNDGGAVVGVITPVDIAWAFLITYRRRT